MTAAKWKTHLLRSGLPLEHLVAEKLQDHRFVVRGEYAYIRPNAHAVPTEFSVDLHAGRGALSGAFWGTLHLLVECKYSQPGIEWVFAPHPVPRSTVSLGCINYMEDLSTWRLRDNWRLKVFEEPLRFCFRGVALGDQKADPSCVNAGLNQLRYGMPNLISVDARAQAATWDEDMTGISFFCPILVTAAPLRVLKEGLGLDEFRNAKELSAVSAQVDCLVVHVHPGQQALAYCEDLIASLHQQAPAVERRLREAHDAGLDDNSRFFTMETFERHFPDSMSRVFVVTYAKLDDLLKVVADAVESCEPACEKVAGLEFDPEASTTRLVPIRR